MQARIAPPRLALDQRAAQLEQLLRRTAVVLGKVPIERWKFLVTLILVVWLSYSLACLFWLFAPAPEIPAASVSSVVSSTGRGATSGEAIDIQALKEAHIFGEADEAAIAEENVSEATWKLADSRLTPMVLNRISTPRATNCQRAGV